MMSFEEIKKLNEAVAFTRKNWKRMTIAEMSKATGFSNIAITRIGMRLRKQNKKLRRQKWSTNR